MIIQCKYLFVNLEGKPMGWSDHHSPALFTLHSSLNHVIIEVARIGGQDRWIRVLNWTASYACEQGN